MHNIQVFKNSEFGEIRSIEINNEPYFIGKDIAEILGYKNTRDAINKHVDEEDKGVANCDTLGGIQELTVINESGLYSLIMSSKLPSAKKFKRWVTNEVLPTIRKHGMYATEQLLDNPDLLIASLQELKKTREEKKQLQKEVQLLEEDNKYLNEILKSKDTILVTVIANDYGMTAQAFNKKLHEMGIQHKIGGTWVLYERYKGEGFVHSKTTEYTKSDNTKGTSVNTEWTQKGRLFLYRKLKEEGIVPLIEQNSRR